MPHTLTEITGLAMELSEEERLLLADALYNSLPAEEDLDPEFVTELERRMDDIRTGRVKTIPWEEVRAQIDRVIDDSPTRSKSQR